MSTQPNTPALKQYEFYPYANIFPLLEGPSFEAFVEDMEDRGQEHLVWLFEDKILDGRNRYRACQRNGIEVRVQTYTGTDPIGFVLSSNLHRRHLSESQRAIVAAKLASLSIGANQHTAKGPSIEKASKLLNVGHASIERAKKVLRVGDPSLVEAVVKGGITVSAAAAIADQPKDQQQKAMKAKGKGKTERAAKKTIFDRLENIWDDADRATQEAFVEAKYKELKKLIREVDQKGEKAAA
jgi:hypothetical protein